MRAAQGANDDLPVPPRCRLSPSTLTPLRQGDLDHLCGLYAIINGIRLLMANQRPLAPPDVRTLWSLGIAILAGRSELTCTMLAGWDGALWPTLLQSLIARAQRITNLAITITNPLTGIHEPAPAAVFAVIEGAIHNGRPALLELTGRRDHYTVVAGYTPAIIRLFDSGNLHWLTRNACGVGDDDRTDRHVIRPASLTVLELGR